MTTNRLRQPVPEVQLGNELLPTRREESVPSQPVLEPTERTGWLVKLECQ
jgi:hypothetical protein